MKNEEKILKETFSFSKLENIKVDFGNITYVKKEGFMSKLARISLAISILLIAIVGALIVFYDQITSVQKKDISKIEKEEKNVVAEIPDINAIVTMVIGEVKVQNLMKLEDVQVGYKLKQGDTIISSEGSECEIQINKKSLVKVGEKTKVSFEEIAYGVKGKKQSIVELFEGNIKTAVKKLSGEEFKVRTSTAVAAVRGTKFSVTVDDKGNTKVVVSEGKVAVSVRSKVIDDLKKEIGDKPELHKLEEIIGEVIVKENESTLVRPEEQKKIDVKIQTIVASESIKKDTESMYNRIRETIEKISLDIPKTKASTTEIKAIENAVSKTLILESEKNVKVRFIPDNNIKNAQLFIDDVIISKLPIEKLFDRGKEYRIKVQVGNKTIFSETMKFTEDGEIVIKDKGTVIEQEVPQEKVQEVPQEITQETVQKEVFEKINVGAQPTIGYGKLVYYGKNTVFATPEGISIFDGKTINKIKLDGVSYGFSDNAIVSISKDENDNLVVTVVDFKGNQINKVNLGERTKGSLVVGRAAIFGGKVFVPSIDGVYVIDLKEDNKYSVKVGSIYSDVSVFGNGIACINEIGEVHFVGTDGSSKKIGQLPITTVRRAYL
ncbi:MAG: FecR domain-containing protein, partial [Brevinematia bacterium]